MNTVWRHSRRYTDRTNTKGNWRVKFGNPNTRPQEGSTERKRYQNEPKETPQGTQNGTEIRRMEQHSRPI
jgi:hypothetical protein